MSDNVRGVLFLVVMVVTIAAGGVLMVHLGEPRATWLYCQMMRLC